MGLNVHCARRFYHIRRPASSGRKFCGSSIGCGLRLEPAKVMKRDAKETQPTSAETERQLRYNTQACFVSKFSRARGSTGFSLCYVRGFVKYGGFNSNSRRSSTHKQPPVQPAPAKPAPRRLPIAESPQFPAAFPRP